MSTSAATGLSIERPLELAHQCMSWVLQFDYLSNGLGSNRGGSNGAVSNGAGRRQCTAPGNGGGTPAHEAGADAGLRDIARQYLAEIATRRRLSSSEEYRLATAARAGDQNARRGLIEHHLGLVAMLARRHRNRGLPLLDLIEEGNLGLMIAVEKFDPERGCRFSTYAKWWIRQSIELALMTQTGVVRVPVYVTRALKRRSRTSADNTSAGDVARGSRFLLYDIRNQASHPAEDSDNERDAVITHIAAPEHEQPDWHLHVAGLQRQLELAMLRLKDAERFVLQARFGLRDDSIDTLQTIARQLNLSSERVRQIQAEALGKLREILQREIGLGREALL
jgi:RNA polymerase nonessential primary-like sigma factor